MAFRTFLAATVATSTLATVLAAPAIAQDDDAADSRRLGTVLVTAQRTEENLQDVPVAVTALSSEDIEDKQVQNIRDLQFLAPNINIATNTGTASAARIFLRGVGEDESRGAVDQAVGIYVDGIYIGRSVGSLMDVVDLEQIEVLRGPQGTLYGRNTIGGAIKLTSVKPQFENSANVLTTIGNEGRLDLRGTANYQIDDRTAFRLTALHRERDGFHTLRPNGDFEGEDRDVGRLHTLAVRGSLYHEFNDVWSVLVSADQTLDRSDPIPDSAAPNGDLAVGGDVDNDIFTIEPLDGTTCSALTPGNFQPLGCFTDYNQRLKSGGASVNIEADMEGVTFTSLTGVRNLDDNLSTRIGFPYFQDTNQDQFSQEFTLASNDGPHDWLLGAYYFTEQLELNTTFVFPFSVNAETESFALFGQGTYNVTDQLGLTGGLRYTTETKELDAEALLSGLSRIDERDFSNISYTVGADYRFNESVLGYAKFSTGFKSGGWSPDAFSPAAVFLPVRKETLDSFEAGVKTDLFSDRVRFNATYFFNTYEDLQIGATVPGLGFTRFNVPETEIQGLEFEWVLQATDNFQINGNLGLLDAEYTELDTVAAGGLTNQGATPACGGVVSVACASSLDLKNAPEYKATLGALYTMPIQGGDLIFSGDVNFEDDSWSLVANDPPHALIDVPTLVNARVKYEAEAGWSVALWGKNLGDEEYYRASSANSFSTYASEPLTYGVELGYEF